MIFAIYPDGKISPAREMIEAMEFSQEISHERFCILLSANVSNNPQI